MHRLLTVQVFCIIVCMLFAQTLGKPTIRRATLSPEGGWIGVGGVVTLRIFANENIKPASCRMNGQDSEGDSLEDLVQYTYIVKEGDPGFVDGDMDVDCRVQNNDGDLSDKITMDNIQTSFTLNLDAESLRAQSVSVSPSSGTLSDGDTVTLRFGMNKPNLEVTSCKVNKVADVEVVMVSEDNNRNVY